jgi:hypothetical protein
MDSCRGVAAVCLASARAAACLIVECRAGQPRPDREMGYASCRAHRARLRRNADLSVGIDELSLIRLCQYGAFKAPERNNRLTPSAFGFAYTRSTGSLNTSDLLCGRAFPVRANIKIELRLIVDGIVHRTVTDPKVPNGLVTDHNLY